MYNLQCRRIKTLLRLIYSPTRGALKLNMPASMPCRLSIGSRIHFLKLYNQSTTTSYPRILYLWLKQHRFFLCVLKGLETSCGTSVPRNHITSPGKQKALLLVEIAPIHYYSLWPPRHYKIVVNKLCFFVFLYFWLYWCSYVLTRCLCRIQGLSSLSTLPVTFNHVYGRNNSTTFIQPYGLFTATLEGNTYIHREIPVR